MTIRLRCANIHCPDDIAESESKSYINSCMSLTGLALNRNIIGCVCNICKILFMEAGNSDVSGSPSKLVRHRKACREYYER